MNTTCLREKTRIKPRIRHHSPNKVQRIILHLNCPCRNWQQARFHIAGIWREFVSW